MLSLRHFQIFQAVALTNSFTKAAQKLFVTQSAISHAIRELEEDIGVLLFDRISKQIQITPAGKLLLEDVTPILASCNALEKKIRHMDMQAPIQIVSSITIAAFWLPHILKKVKEQIPNTPIYVNVVSAAEAIHLLKKGDADIACIEGTLPQEPFCSRQFDEYSLEIVCSPDYPVPSHNLNLEEFCSQNLLLREKGSAIRDVLDSQLYLLGYTAYPIWTSVNSTALIEAAKSDVGITVLPNVLVEKELDRNKLISLTVEHLSLKNALHVVWHKEKYLSSPLQLLLAEISNYHL